MASKRKRKPKTKTKTKSNQIGHNSDGHKDQEEMRRIAKAQRNLNRRKKDAMDAFKKEHKDLTNRLEAAGYTREEFKEPFDDFCAIADCDTDEDVKIVVENQKIRLANKRRIHDALSPNAQLDWINLIQDADEIRKLRDEAEATRAAEAAEAGENATDTPAEV